MMFTDTEHSGCKKISNYSGSKFRGSRFKVRLMKIERFEDIEAWQPVESLKVVRLARELTRKMYRLTKKPGLAKDYVLNRQIQDAAGSSMHNIAEGFDSEIFTNRQDEHVLPFVDSSTISRNMKNASQQTVNREPDNLSSYEDYR